MAVPESIRHIAITGSPGVGKTTLCENLEGVVSLMELAAKLGALGEECSDGAKEVDIEKMKAHWPDDVPFIIDGHLSHLLPVDAIVILRCNPIELERRLGQREYSVEKTQANVEYEMLGGPWPDLIGDERPIIEFDNTSFEADLASWLENGCPHSTKPEGAIDWLSIL